jgi:hypothetical protein
VYGLAAIGLCVIKGFGGTLGDVDFADFALHVVRCGSVELLTRPAMAGDTISISIIVDPMLHGQLLVTDARDWNASLRVFDVTAVAATFERHAD